MSRRQAMEPKREETLQNPFPPQEQEKKTLCSFQARQSTHQKIKMETPPLSSKESRINRYKPIWRFLLISNLALGAYMFAKARKKNSSIMDNKPAKTGAGHGKNETESDVSSDPVTTALVYEEPPILPVVAQPAKVLEPIPEDQQREVFKWILEEKRKVKPNDPEARKRINEEKAVLKQFIRAESLPRI